MPDPKRPWKAVGAFALAFLGALLATIQGRTDLGDMKPVDWLIVVGSAVVTAGTVYQIKNPAAPPA
jgi:hypothetical protein